MPLHCEQEPPTISCCSIGLLQRQQISWLLAVILDFGLGTADGNVLGSGGKCACDMDFIAMGMPALGVVDAGAFDEELG